jgi:hypothetical protein
MAARSIRLLVPAAAAKPSPAIGQALSAGLYIPLNPHSSYIHPAHPLVDI